MPFYTRRFPADEFVRRLAPLFQFLQNARARRGYGCTQLSHKRIFVFGVSYYFCCCGISGGNRIARRFA
jgi:hypothetical protein